MAPSQRDRGLGSCLAAFAARLVLPAVYLALATVYPIVHFDLGLGAALGWIAVSALIVPFVVLIAVLRLSGRGRGGGSAPRRR